MRRKPNKNKATPEAGGFQPVEKPTAGKNKSFGQAFSKACGVQRQRLWSRSADRETLSAFNFGKKEAWRKPPFLKGADFSILNHIREADTADIQTDIHPDIQIDMHSHMQNRHANVTFIPTSIATCKIDMQTDTHKSET